MKYYAERLTALEHQRVAQQGKGRPILSWVSNFLRFVAVGGEIYSSPNWGTFHDFLMDFVVEIFGRDWFLAELRKQTVERHPVAVWQQDVARYGATLFTGGNRFSNVAATGAVAAFLNFSYCLYLVSHNIVLQKAILRRLKNIDQFYGAYYELLVAAQFIKSGFIINYENEADTSASHVEFVAECENSGKKYSVEAKSRRPNDSEDVGVTDINVLCAKIKRKLFAALKKNAEYERIVFIDASFRDRRSCPNKEVLKGLSIKLREMEHDSITNGNPSPKAYVIVTNYPYHYELKSADYICSAMGLGFKIREFNYDSVFSTLREALVARDRHKDLFDLIECMRNQEVPSTFDGEIPEFAFCESDLQRLLIGNWYLVPNEQGEEVEGQLESACVLESEECAYGSFLLKGGGRIIVKMPLAKHEMQAYRRYPETFFGEVGCANRRAADGIDFFDFLFAEYSKTPKDKLLTFMESWPDFDELKNLPEEELAYVYCLRLAESEYYR